MRNTVLVTLVVFSLACASCSPNDPVPADRKVPAAQEPRGSKDTRRDPDKTPVKEKERPRDGDRPTRREGPDGQPFARNVLITGKTKDSTADLLNPRIRTLGGKQFIVGEENKDSKIVQEHFRGATIWISVDEVVKIIEIQSIEKKRQREE